MLNLYKVNKLTNRFHKVFSEISNNVQLIRDKIRHYEDELKTLKSENINLKEVIAKNEELMNSKNNEIIELKKSIDINNINSVNKENYNLRSNEEIDGLIEEIEYCIERLKSQNG